MLKNITSQAKAVDIAAINLCCSKTGSFPPCDRARGGLYYPGNTAAILTVLKYSPGNTAAPLTVLKYSPGNTAAIPAVLKIYPGNTAAILTVLNYYPGNTAAIQTDAGASEPQGASEYRCCNYNAWRHTYFFVVIFSGSPYLAPASGDSHGSLLTTLRF